MAKRRISPAQSDFVEFVLLPGIGVVGIYFLARYAIKMKAQREVREIQPVTPSPPEPSGDIDAPPFPFDLDEAKAVEAVQTKARHDEWVSILEAVMDSSGTGIGGPPTEEDYAEARAEAEIPGHRTIPGVLTDEAFAFTYGGFTIPKKADRGQGWQPFIDSWVRMQDLVKQEKWVGG